MKNRSLLTSAVLGSHSQVLVAGGYSGGFEKQPEASPMSDSRRYLFNRGVSQEVAKVFHV